MTTPEPADRPLTAADLLYGSAADAPKALTRQIMSAGHAQSLGQALKRLPRVTREAAAHEAALAAAVLLKVDLMDILVAGWREHRDIISAARRTLAGPGSKELVGVAPHRISTVQQPAVSVLLDGRRVHTLQLGLSIIFDVTGLVAGIHAGRLAGIHAGRCEIGVALTIHEIEVLTKRAHHLELPGVKSLRSGLRLLPASEYPASEYPASEHPASEHLSGGQSGGSVPGTAFAESRFPAVALAGAERAGTEHQGSQYVGTEHQGSQYVGTEHLSSQYAGAQHASSQYQSGQYQSGQYQSATYSGGEHPSSGPPAGGRPPAGAGGAGGKEGAEGAGAESPPSWWESAEPLPPPDRRY
jgi:hypothetical protein